jgi:hypothetical protein
MKRTMPTKKKQRKRTDIIFPKREAELRDIVAFATWAGVEFHLNLAERKVDPGEARTVLHASGRPARRGEGS